MEKSSVLTILDGSISNDQTFYLTWKLKHCLPVPDCHTSQVQILFLTSSPRLGERELDASVQHVLNIDPSVI